MGHLHERQRAAPKRMKRFMYTSLILTMLSLGFLFWICRYDKTFQLWANYLKINIAARKCIPGKTVLQGQSASLVTVNGTYTLLVSAYLEHRTKKKEVRVIAIVLRSEKISYLCHMRCQEKMHISNECKTPSHVAVTSAATKSEDALHDTFLEVKNQNVTTNSYPYNFTVCLSTMFDFTNVLQLVQSLEMFQILGVNRVVVYKTNCSIETQRVLDYYTHKGLIEVIPWSLSSFLNVSRSWLPKHGPGELHYFGQIPALTDFLYRYMYKTKYVALHDIDELILPQSVNSWLELLPMLEKQYGADKCYAFQNHVFPNHVWLPPPKPQAPLPQGHWANVSGVNILDHLYHEPIMRNTSDINFKIILNPRIVFTPTVHGVVAPKKICRMINRKVARLYHTRQKQLELKPKELIYDGRLVGYSARLTPAVDTVLKDNRLLPPQVGC
ncbi:uncharacterized protein LOC133442030 isoform X2 [Cololabis saira]|uniref:uncharacterized protein LOC133442030 isoform X2 n=1 Tax=Cololabis saira TaxID=129043 RepID=UPI002AD285F6|nr:uncharacterized protein LOC133442030 isoform X2 [Cololabis saira]